MSVFLKKKDSAFFFGGAPTSIFHFFCPSICPSVHPPVHLSICLSTCPSVRCLPYLRYCTSYDHYFWYTCTKWWKLQAFFSFYENFDILVWGVKGKKIAQSEKQKFNLVVCYISGTVQHMIIISGTQV